MWVCWCHQCTLLVDLNRAATWHCERLRQTGPLLSSAPSSDWMTLLRGKARVLQYSSEDPCLFAFIFATLTSSLFFSTCPLLWPYQLPCCFSNTPGKSYFSVFVFAVLSASYFIPQSHRACSFVSFRFYPNITFLGRCSWPTSLKFHMHVYSI